MFSNIKRIFGLSVSIILITSAFCLADTIYLKSGRVIDGKIVEETEEFVKIRLMDMNFYSKYKKKFIAKIKKDVDEDGLAGKNALTVEQEYKQIGSNRNKSNTASRIFSNINTQPQLIEEEGYIVYLPAGMDQFQSYPLVIIFHPAAKARDMIEFWRPIADQKQFILYASKKFRNDVVEWIKPEDRMIREVCRKYPVDKSRVIVTGLSGGGMGAHMYSVFRSDLISAVITNVGRIHPGFKRDKQNYPKQKIVAFLASAEDTNYRQMQEDRSFLAECRWRTRWITFDGGHVMAPLQCYQMAVEWIEFLWK